MPETRDWGQRDTQCATSPAEHVTQDEATTDYTPDDRTSPSPGVPSACLTSVSLLETGADAGSRKCVSVSRSLLDADTESVT